MTTIGRVDFIVGLDGNRLPQQARRLARQMEAAGTRAGKSFSDAFESRFDQNLSQIAGRFSDRLGREGRLAGATFSDDFSNVVQSRFRGIQRNLAEILADKDAFADYARGFDNVGDAVKQLETDLDRLRGQTVQYTDENGKLRERLVLTSQQARDFGTEIRRLGGETEELLTKERALGEATRDLEANYTRLTRTVGDSDAFRQMSERVGGTGVAFNRLRNELIETGTVMGRSKIEIEEYVDRLERTRDGVDRASSSMIVLDDRTGKLDRAFLALGRTMIKPWTYLERDVRLVIGIIASAADQVAVLGSALGAGLVAVGGAAAQGIIGVGGLAAVFVTLGKEIDELPPHLQDVAREFGDLKTSLTGAREVIASGAFQQMDGVFVSLSDTVRGLSPEFDDLGRSVGNVFRDFARNVRPGTEAFKEIAELVDLSGEGFERLSGIAGTFGLGLVRSFNRAQPLVEDFYGWLDRLANRFEEFSRSDSFDTWIASAQNVWGSFGDLLDQIGRSLNNLASPAAVQRTTDLLDNLTEFIPNLERFLDVLGRLDPLGLLAELLNDVGAAFEPLAEPVGELAEALNRLLSISIDSFATGLHALSSGLAPAVEGLAAFLNAIPDEALGVFSSALIASVGAFAIFRGVQGIAGAITAMGAFVTKTTAAAGASAALGASISKGLGRAGLVGAAIVGVVALSSALDDMYRSATKLDDTSRNLIGNNASLASAYEKLGGSVLGVLPPLTDVDTALNNLNGSGIEGMLGGIGNAFRDGGNQANALSQTLSELSKPLADLALRDLPAASAQFAAWATELGASDSQVLNMLGTMPEFKQVLIDTALATGVAATDANLLALALGESVGPASAASDAVGGVGSAAALAAGEIEGLSDRIRNFGDTEISTIEATIAFEAAVDDLTASVAENGATLDLNTEAGRTNTTALLDAIQGAKDHAAAVYDETGNLDLANATLATQKQRLIDTIREMDNAGYEAGLYTDVLNTIPPNVLTTAELAGIAAAEAALARLTRDRYVKIIAWGDTTAGITGQTGFGVPQMASGGILTGPTHVYAGEAGREAFVPLDRPLSQVDPSVRWLSAIAQGISSPMATGGVVGAGQHIERVDITVISDDPDRAGDSVLRALSENLGR